MVQPYGDLNIVFPCPAMNQRCLQHAFKRSAHAPVQLSSLLASYALCSHFGIHHSTPVVWFRSSIASKSNLIAALSFQRRVLPHPLHAL
jgi:hypothetical protein